MKNSFKIITLICILCFQNIAFSDSFTLKSKNIEILDEGDQINAYKGTAISKDNNLEIISDKYIYYKETDILKSIGNGLALIKSKKIKIKYDNAVFDQKNLSIKANGNIEVFQIDGSFIIKNDQIFYDQKNNIVSSDQTTKIEDNFGNTHFVDSFVFEINKNLIKAKNLISKDAQSNTFKTSIAYINTSSGKVFGKDVKIDLNNSSSQNYRLRGNSGNIDENSSGITKGVFTTCKKREGCPPWQFSAKNITHDKKKREISYDNALLRVYDLPIAYFPKFFHPDPTVKRRSGFLIPAIKNSPNSDNYLNTPYFLAIAENKDATFSPRLYADDKILLQTEYRQVNSNTNHIADFSLFAEKDENSKNHFFYEYDKNLTVQDFESSKLNLKLQTTSNDTYLKSDKIKSDLINDNDTMVNSLNLDLYSNNLSINLSSTIYENLSKKDNDRYEYIFPRLKLAKNFNNLSNLDGNFLFESDTLVRQYDTNVLEKRNVNNFIFNSIPQISKYGFLNSHEFLVRNTNSENRNSDYKNKKNFFISSMYQFNSSFPLIKDEDNYQKIFKPKISLKAAPNHTKNERSVERKINITNIYSLDRTTDDTSVEGGLSAAYGFDYSILDKLNTNELFNFKLANNFRLEQNDDLPNNNQIGEKTSNLFSEIMFNPSEAITTKYISSIKNNLQDINYENLITDFKFNNFITTFDYLNENNTSSKSSYLSNTTSYNLNKSNSFAFSTRKNKAKDLTEYYNFMYQYKNDCLAASIEYNKDFYSDRELKPDESIFFKLTITPFAEVSSPNIKQ
ncbi:LPS-assembly protein LptD [Candidatus Pelagibacter communis]|uniref:LPS-assembly protein LptD n=1 Tax=Pelagibacter ubique TaxID=198252 RepID=UPI00094CC365|nr:LPS-assembly protein LptD [Candidatus Pelagibacter ubique]